MVDLEELKDDELRKMQGNTKKAILMRLKQIEKLESQLKLIVYQLHQISDLIPEDTMETFPDSDKDVKEEKIGQGSSSNAKGKDISK